MNWLIIADEEYQLILSRLITSYFYGSKIFLSDTKKQSIEKVIYSLDDITHFVYVGEKLFSVSQFLCGYFSGKGIPVYLCSASNLKFIQEFKNCKFYKNIESFEKFIKSDYETIIKEFDERLESFSKSRNVDAEDFYSFIKKGNYSSAKKYLSEGFDINSKDCRGTPILNLSVRDGKMEAVKFLIENGADLNCISSDRGYTPLMDAIFCGFDDLALYLCSKKNCDANVVSKEGQTAIILAVGSEKTKVCAELAKIGADVDFPDSMGMSAYGYATLFKKTEIASVLEKYHKE